MPHIEGAMEFTPEELEELFREDAQQETPPAESDTNNPPPAQATEGNGETAKTDGIETSKAFAKRLREKTEQVRNEEREAIAKSLGYDSFADMQSKREKQLLEDRGLDPEQVNPIVDELVKKRLDSDPRMKELETLRAKQVQEFGKRELAEVTELTGGEITSLAQLPKEVIELWKQTGSLKSAYLSLRGEELIRKARSEQSKGSTQHLQNPSGPIKPAGKERPLTAEEKRVWKFFNPSITDEELNKKTTTM